MAELKRGRVVKSIAGRDSGYLLVVIQAEGKTVTVCDGKERPLDRPKSKNIRHTEPTEYMLTEADMLTDRALRKALRRIDVLNCNN